MQPKNVFERLMNGETISPKDSDAYQMRTASNQTKKLLLQMNSLANPDEIRDLLGQITGSLIHESTAVFTPLYINYGRNTKIGKGVFIHFPGYKSVH